MCEEPLNILFGVFLPWLAGAVVNHLQIYSYLINWTALITSMYVQFVCPLFMWSKATKEANIYETNFKASLQMILAPPPGDSGGSSGTTPCHNNNNIKERK